MALRRHGDADFKKSIKVNVMAKENRHIRAFRHGILQPGEMIFGVLEGWQSVSASAPRDGGVHGILALTDRRVCFYRKRLVGHIFWQAAPRALAAVEAGTEAGLRVLRLVTAEDGIVFKTYARKTDFDAFVARLNAAPAEQIVQEVG